MEAPASEASVGELLGSLVRETGSLVRQEMSLARTEMAAKAHVAATKGGSILLGGALAHAGLLALIAALVIGLGSTIPLWLSALVVGGVLTITGYVVARAGISGFRHLDPMPTQTIESVKEVISPNGVSPAPANAIWAKEKAR